MKRILSVLTLTAIILTAFTSLCSAQGLTYQLPASVGDELFRQLSNMVVITVSGEVRNLKVQVGDQQYLIDVWGKEKPQMSVKVGMVEYTTDARSPYRLQLVRVWKGPDSLLYDLTEEGVDYVQSYGNTPKAGEEMTKVEAKADWNKYCRKFGELRRKLQVVVEE